MSVQVLQGDCRELLKTLPAESVHCVVTSPPYFGLRAYSTEPQIWGGNPDCPHEWNTDRYYREGGNSVGSGLAFSEPGEANAQRLKDTRWRENTLCVVCGAWRGELGGEPTPQVYVEHIVEVFRAVRRVLRDDGTLWLNLGDSYAGSWGSQGYRETPATISRNQIANHPKRESHTGTIRQAGLKPKDLIGIPWRVAFALQDDGWWVRQDLVWCLSGGTHVYTRTQKGDMPMMLRDAARLDPATVKLWNGEKWTQVLGWSRTARDSTELEIVLRSGERISCTPTHKFPTSRGLVLAGDLTAGDLLTRVSLPEPDMPKDSTHISTDAAWLAGLYLAEGSHSGNSYQISGHVKEEERWERVQAIVASYGGTVTRAICGNKMDIRIYGRIAHSVIDHFICGKSAKDKGLNAVAWRYSNEVLRALLDGYLSGDGHWDGPNNRWRLGFTRNYAWERDLRTLAARLGFHLVLKLSFATYQGGTLPAFRGELRFERSGHWNEAQPHEIAEIRKARCREVYDVGVEDEPHLFALASGILTHNSKKAPMPESVADRCTKSHEYVFLLAKAERYFFDADAIAEPSTGVTGGGFSESYAKSQPRHGGMILDRPSDAGTRNKRSVWHLGPEPLAMAHFAVMPTKLVEPCILAGTSEEGCCPRCLAPWQRVVERTRTFESGSGRSGNLPEGKNGLALQGGGETLDIRRGPTVQTQTTGWEPTCKCGWLDDEGPDQKELIPHEPIPCTVLDPFAGSGTTLRVATKHRRNAIGIELNPDYCALIEKRLTSVPVTLPMGEAV